MPWNPAPEIKVARDAANKLGAEVGVVVVWLNRETVGMVSYGLNAALCDKMGELGEHLYQATKDYYAGEDQP